MSSTSEKFFQWACESDQCKRDPRRPMGILFNLHDGHCWRCKTPVTAMPEGRQIFTILNANGGAISGSQSFLETAAPVSPVLSAAPLSDESPITAEHAIAARFAENRELAKSARHNGLKKKHIGGRNVPFGITIREQAPPPRAMVYQSWRDTY